MLPPDEPPAVPTSAAVDALRDHPLFADLDPTVVASLGAASTPLQVDAGDVLLREGEPGDAAFLVLGGRFAVTASGRLVGRPSRGDLIGEMALLGDAPRSATVTALRASVVLRIDGAAFAEQLGRQPALHRRVSAQLVERVRLANAGPPADSAGRVIAVLTDRRPSTDRLAAELASALRRVGADVAVVQVGAAGVDSATVTVAELDHDVVLLTSDAHDEAAVAATVAHADRIVVGVDATSAPPTARTLRLPDRRPPVALVLAHPAETDCPRGTHRFLAALDPAEHHHVRAGDPAHLERVARRLIGAEVALVLSGGGARGMAHLGTFRALAEAGVPVDVVAGVSAGSIFAVALARGWEPTRCVEIARRMLIDGGSLVDPTLPTVALASGRKITRRLQEVFGDDDLRLEDLWLPTMVVSANLTTADAHEHHSGLAWRAVRASVAIPGVFPPVAESEGLLVDGGIVDNLPVGRMRRRYPTATVIASDVGRRVEFVPEGFPPDGEVSGWWAWRLRRRFRRERRIPGLVGLLGRLTALGGAGIAAERGDVHIDHELPGVGMFDFGKGIATVAAGHARAAAVLAAVDAAVLPMPLDLRPPLA